MEATSHPPTEEMLHIMHLFTATSSPIIVNSYAGTGKTTIAELLLSIAPKAESAVYLVFNLRNKEEADERFAAKAAAGIRFPPYLIKTLNGFCYGVWCQALGRKPGQVPVDDKKTYKLFGALVDELAKFKRSEAYDQYSEIKAAVDLAKALGHIPFVGIYRDSQRLIEPDDFWTRLQDPLTSFAKSLVDEILLRSIKAAFAGNIDYNDQVYMPALFGGPWPDFPLVIGDEFQDNNPTGIEVYGRLIKKGSRLVAVGDTWQSIYAFRGAQRGGMDIAKRRFEMTEAKLTVSFRCPENIVRGVHWRVPDMKWIKEGGIARRHFNPSFNTFPDGSAIICRNNAPLYALALRLLAAGRGVSVVGSEIGPKIIGIMKKFGPASLPQENVYEKIQDWLDAKLAKGSTTAADTADCMCVFAERGKTLGLAIAYAESLFKQQGPLVLITGHKAKGLEWDTVYHLDPDLCKESDQDQNLRYVIQTRAKREYYEISSEDIK